MDIQEIENPELHSKCGVCLNEPPTNAIRLDCDHIFCFLCVKSTNETSGVCPLCRAEIGIEFNYRPHNILGPIRIPTSKDGYFWFYRVYQGWHLYDAESNIKIEEAYSKNEKQLELFLAGFMYVINFETMSQQRKEKDGRPRDICRSTLALENVNGMAGIRGPEFEDVLSMMKTTMGM